MRTSAGLLLLIASILAGLASSAAAELQTTVLLRTGDAVPALGAGVTWQSFLTRETDATISDQGRIAFAGIVAGPGIDSNNSTVLMTGPINGPYRVVARGGTPAPGTPAGVLFNQPALGYLTESGRVLFYSTLAGPGITTANDTGLWLESPTPGGDPLPVIREGGEAPGLDGLTIASFDIRSVAFQPRFQLIALVATLGGPGVTAANSSVLYQSSIDEPSQVTVQARAGQPIVNQVGVSYGTFGSTCYAGGPNAIQLLVRNTLVGGAITTATDGAFLLFTPAVPGAGVVIVEGTPIPGQPVGTYNQLLGAYGLGSTEVGYFGTVTGLTTPNGAMWIGSPLGASGGNPRPLGLRGTPAPGFPAGAIMVSAVIDRFDVASTGRAVYAATCSGTGVTTANDQGLFSEALNGINQPALIAREGALPPGLSAPSVFSAFGGLFSNFTINARNQLAFFTYAPPGATGDAFFDTGLWVTDAAGVTHLVAHRTRPFTLSATDTRTPSSVGYRVLSTPQLPARRWFLDDGRLITTLTFTDNTAALVLVHVDPLPLCRADFNNDGDDTLQDLFDFLFAWFAQNPAADINGIDGITVQDLFDFLFFWFGGCP